MLSGTFNARKGKTIKVNIPTTRAQRHAINTKGAGANDAVIDVDVNSAGAGGTDTTYRTTKTGHVTLIKKNPDVALRSSPNLIVQRSSDGPFLSVTLRCAGNEDDNQACDGSVKVLISGSTTVPTSPYSAPPGVPTVVNMAINEKGLPGDKPIKKGRSNARIVITTAGGKTKNYVGHVTLIKQ